MDKETIGKNLDACRAALQRIGRGDVEICAVTKTMSAETVNCIRSFGITRIGENRVQELLLKFPALNPGFSVDLIGQLQTNKVKYILNCVDRIESLDRMPLAAEIDRRASALGKTMPCLVQVNIAREMQKGGVTEEELLPFLREAARLPGIRICGLMAIMPQTEDSQTLRPYFRRMRTWFERLRDEAVAHVSMECLSMGMSGDYLIAAEEGATLVRLGSAIFGSRPKPKQ